MRIPRLFRHPRWPSSRAGIDLNLARLSPRAKVASGPPIPAGSSRTSAIGRTIRTIGVSSSTRRSRKRRARLMRSRTVRLYHDHMLTKEPHPPADAVAPGPALLQHRRPAEHQLLDPGRSGEPGFHPGIRRGFASWALAHAALLHGLPGEVVSRGNARRSAGHRGQPRRIFRFSAGNSSRAMPYAFTC